MTNVWYSTRLGLGFLYKCDNIILSKPLLIIIAKDSSQELLISKIFGSE